MDNNRFLAMLGFAAKARALVSGETGCLVALSKRQVRLFVQAADASANSQDRFSSRCKSAGCKLVRIGEAEELGRAIGKSPRTCIAILDDRFAKTILEALGESANM